MIQIENFPATHKIILYSLPLSLIKNQNTTLIKDNNYVLYLKDVMENIHIHISSRTYQIQTLLIYIYFSRMIFEMVEEMYFYYLFTVAIFCQLTIFYILNLKSEKNNNWLKSTFLPSTFNFQMLFSKRYYMQFIRMVSQLEATTKMYIKLSIFFYYLPDGSPVCFLFVFWFVCICNFVM